MLFAIQPFQCMVVSGNGFFCNAFFFSSPLFSLQGGVKVLITGPWQEASNNYSCLFDQISVPASLIQPGVLRCYCPGMEHFSSRAGGFRASSQPNNVMYMP